LDSLLAQFPARAGVFVYYPQTSFTYAYQADSLFPTASLIKVPILVTLFTRIVAGSLAYDSTLIWTPEVVSYPPDGGLVSSLRDSTRISLRRLVSLMITYSDNHAALWCQALAGGGTNINATMDRLGFSSIRVNSRTPGRRRAWERYGWGEATPREMALLLWRIRQRNLISPAADQEMYRVLSRIYWDGEALSQVPPYVQVASKQGAVDEARSEVVLVNAPHGDYVFCVMTSNQKDTSWKADNEGFVLIRQVSRMLWEAFEPHYPWQGEDVLGQRKF